MKSDKNLVKFILGLNALLFVGMFSFMFVYDPLQIFHKSFRAEMRVNYNMRQQAAGIINNYDFDSIIFGTSMLENTSSAEASKVLGGNFVNISMSDSDFFERKHVLDYMATKKQLKTVIFSMDEFFLERRKGHPEYQFSTFDFLYDRNPFNDFKVYLNSMFAKCVVKLAINHPDQEHCIGKRTTMDRPSAWMDNPFFKGRFGGLEKWFQSSNDAQITNAFAEINRKITSEAHLHLEQAQLNAEMAATRDYLKKYVLEVATAIPKTSFYFIFPPYSRAKYAIWAKAEPVKFQVYLESIRFLAKESAVYPNVKIFGFEDQAFLDDLANYKDLSHYHPDYNSQMLIWIKEEKGQLKADNVDVYLQTVEQKARQYSLRDLSEKIENFLNSRT